MESIREEGTENNVDCTIGCIVIGMAASGKSTLMQQLNAQLSMVNEQPYIMNLDPAVLSVPYQTNIDIRDSINYKAVMEKYKLGPNGAILTCLNLFCTRFDQVLSLIETHSNEGLQHVLIDTPGQIEAFTWSASGTIITDALASSIPTVILYIVDTPRCAENALTFSSNMLHACSILYKTRLPMIIVFNKSDVISADQPRSWMNDYLAFDQALVDESSFATSFARSMALALDEFYRHITSVEVSAMTGEGFTELLEAIDHARDEYNLHYKPILESRTKQREQEKSQQEQEQLSKFRSELDPSDRNQTEKTIRQNLSEKMRAATASENAPGAGQNESEESEEEKELLREFKKSFQLTSDSKQETKK